MFKSATFIWFAWNLFIYYFLYFIFQTVNEFKDLETGQTFI